MPTIVEHRIGHRPNTDTLFFNSKIPPETGEAIQPTVRAFLAAMAPYKASGRFTSTYTFDTTELIKTNIDTFADLEVYNFAKNITTIEFDAAFYAYMVTNNLFNPANAYTQTGIDQPFRVTTAYTFNPEDISMFETMIDTLETSFGLESFTNTGTVVTAVHHYADSADFTENRWQDFVYTPYLHAEGVTRTVNYELL